jgi:hypothetical protein
MLILLMLYRTAKTSTNYSVCMFLSRLFFLTKYFHPSSYGQMPYLTSLSSNGIVSLFAGGLFGVEKVEPDPLNLLVKTDVGKQIIYKSIVFDENASQHQRDVLFFVQTTIE